MAIWQAKQVCPDLVVLPADMNEYIRFSKMAHEIYERYTDQIEPFGLDESWLDVTGSVGLFGSAMSIAEEIRERIKFELGITASIGVSDNKITAKLGSDYKKPDAITRIERDNYKELVYPLPAADLLYVGPATERKLRGVGIYTIGQLAEASPELLEYKLGKMGLVLHTFANGLDISPVQRSDHIRAIKSVGNSATTPRDLVNDDDVRLMCCIFWRKALPAGCGSWHQSVWWSKSASGTKNCTGIAASGSWRFRPAPVRRSQKWRSTCSVAAIRGRHRYAVLVCVAPIW